MFGEIRQLIGNSEAFPVLKNWTFFNHAGVCPLPAAAADAFRKYAGQAEERAYLFTGWYQDIEKLRHIAAELIGRSPGRDRVHQEHQRRPEYRRQRDRLAVGRPHRHDRRGVSGKRLSLDGAGT